MVIPRTIEKYLASYSVGGAWHLSTGDREGVDNIVVIPSLAESRHLFKTLASLAGNPEGPRSRTLVICVVNNTSARETSSEEIADNQLTLEVLRSLADSAMPHTDAIAESVVLSCAKVLHNKLRIAYVDASSPGREMPDTTGGVGLARKIGLDLALGVFDYGRDGKKLLFSLDADTLVGKNYLEEVRNYFESATHDGAVVEFAHTAGENPDEQAAICCYEVFLRYYVLGLAFARSPYAFHTIGSTMVCTADGYGAVRGMNRRKAGEDFYFLNKLAKISGVGRISDTCVYPSSRASNRVPFGTGRRVTRFLDGSHSEYVVYNPQVFVIVKRLCEYVSLYPECSGETFLDDVRKIHPLAEKFFRERHFEDVWSRLQENTRNPQNLIRHFHLWFDGFKTLKLIHYLTRGGISPIDMFDATEELLAMVGEPPSVWREEGMVPSVESQMKLLQCLRRVENDLITFSFNNM